MPSLLRRLVAPPLYSERLTPAQWRIISLVRTIMGAIAVSIDVGILVAMRGHPQINHEALWFFVINNVAILSVAMLVAAGTIRFASLRKLRIVGVSAVAEIFTLVVWVQATGTVTSYFLVTGLIVIVVYRMFLGYWVGLAAMIALVVFHVGAGVLEMTGVLRPEALFVGEPGQVYSVVVYQGFALTSIALVYALTFVAMNAVSNKLREKEQALAEVRREVARVAEEVKHGRLSGTLLADEYALGEVLGRGGMGEIYMARRVSDDEPVAVKILHGHLVDDETHLERFRREAIAAERIPRRYTARILDVGSAPEQNLYYIAMEYLRGEDLAAFLRRRGPLDPEELLPLANQIAEALDAAHEVNVIHRDLKPQNVFLVEAGRRSGSNGRRTEIKLLDFGTSKILDSGEETLTKADAVIGTIAYMAPEQALGQTGNIGPAADRFAFAAILYRAFTGKLPFQAGDLLGAIREIVHADPPPPSTLRPKLHRDIDAVLAIGMAKRIGDRYPSARAMIEDLDRAVRGDLDEPTRLRARELASITADAETVVAEV